MEKAKKSSPISKTTTSRRTEKNVGDVIGEIVEEANKSSTTRSSINEKK